MLARVQEGPVTNPAPVALTTEARPTDPIVDQPVISQPVVTAAQIAQPPRVDIAPSRSMATQPSVYGARRVTYSEQALTIPPLMVPTTDISVVGSKQPEDIGGQAFSQEKTLPEGFDRSETWALTAYFWHAPNTFSHPLFFEDVMLERHGHERFPCLQPFVSGGRFFATIPALPYLAAVRDPWDCDYHLGHYRPGTCAPLLRQRPPYERRAAIIQAGATAGAIIAFP